METIGYMYKKAQCCPVFCRLFGGTLGKPPDSSCRAEGSTHAAGQSRHADEPQELERSVIESEPTASSKERHALPEEYSSNHVPGGNKSLPAPVKLAVQKYINDCLYGS